MLLYPVFALIKLFHIHSSTYYNKQNVIVPCLRSYQAFFHIHSSTYYNKQNVIVPCLRSYQAFPHT